MKKNISYATAFLAGVSCVMLGVMLGYFIFGPVGAFASVGNLFQRDEPQGFIQYEESVPMSAPIAKPEEEKKDEPSFIVTANNGYIVVYQTHAGNAPELRETTPAPINALPYEEQERLALGIRVYSEDALMRLLEDYDS
ncbi:MAG: hypothetical protein FWG87_03585 [Defluviitaleaceae bacterium]|nr:hypothetical protein [Defluviitaleaceae bacterium]